MSKLKELQARYSGKLFTKDIEYFYNQDFTPTAKYAEYMIKSWCNRKTGYGYVNRKAYIVETVQKFDGLLPYIDEKDIYSPKYAKITDVLKVIELAEERKDEKTFVKEDHILVLKETETYIMLIPLTHKGSVKYGAKTKWCTASKNNDTTFKSYTRKDFLCYLINKKITNPTFEKIALYGNDSSSFNGQFDVYKATDSRSDLNELVKNGWNKEDLLEIGIIFRNYIAQAGKYKQARTEINSVIDALSLINRKNIEESIKILSKDNEKDIHKLIVANEEFIKKLTELTNFKI